MNGENEAQALSVTHTAKKKKNRGMIKNPLAKKARVSHVTTTNNELNEKNPREDFPRCARCASLKWMNELWTYRASAMNMYGYALL